MLTLLRMLSFRLRRKRVPTRKVRSEIETLKRWSERLPDDRYLRDD